jgi:uncharacterized membrane protein YeiH
MLEITDIIGIIAFAISGFIIGVKNKLDLLGIVISAFLTALGGGILRDVMANREIYAFTNLLPGTLVMIVVILGIWFKIHRYDFEKNALFLLSDSIGLVSFAISGSIVAKMEGFNIFGVVFLALITAVGGGVFRDVLINQVPFILKEKFYGSVAILVGLFIYFFGSGFFSVVFTFIFGVLLRIIAHKKNWQLPKI